MNDEPLLIQTDLNHRELRIGVVKGCAAERDKSEARG